MDVGSVDVESWFVFVVPSRPPLTRYVAEERERERERETEIREEEERRVRGGDCRVHVRKGKI